MDQLSPQHVPIYATDTERRRLWQRCLDAGRPVIAIRDATRGYVVHYDLQHLDAELTPGALATIRERTRSWRHYPTSVDETAGPVMADPISETEGVGGEAGSISGALHTGTEKKARRLASHLSPILFDRTRWQ